LSISHQFPLVGMSRVITSPHHHDQQQHDQQQQEHEQDSCHLLVGLDIVIFDPVNTKLYQTEQEFLNVFRESFTEMEWNCIMVASHPMEEFYVRWAIKEAYTKAKGLGMAIDFASFEVSLEDLETSRHDGERNKPILSLWKYIMKEQQREAAKHDVGLDGNIPNPLHLPATVRFLHPSDDSIGQQQNERYSFFFLPLENGAAAKGCACVCAGSTSSSDDDAVVSRQIEVKVTWTSLNALMEWHGFRRTKTV
jgi:phosphopantetheine--protein transferase-like protein